MGPVPGRSRVWSQRRGHRDYVVQLVPSLRTCSGKACVVDRAGVAWVTPKTTDSVRTSIPS